ncbi:MAG: hypothetical protein CBC34_010230 [Hyphomicrobiaceae bacterium TMED74]|nr:MAG: hypothetical protein CBC34_010230 [Hyphomicrobiaceae bacterium TMED74]
MIGGKSGIIRAVSKSYSRSVTMDKGAMTAPLPVRIAMFVFLTAIVGGGLYLWSVRGHAVLLDMAASAIAFICQ